MMINEGMSNEALMMAGGTVGGSEIDNVEMFSQGSWTVGPMTNLPKTSKRFCLVQFHQSRYFFLSLSSYPDYWIFDENTGWTNMGSVPTIEDVDNVVAGFSCMPFAFGNKV